MNKALLDTDIYSEVLKAVDRNVIGNASAYRLLHGRYTISVITVMEIIHGLRKVGASPRRFHQVRSSIALEEVLGFDQPSAELAGQIQGDLDRVGQPIGISDPMIAAIAITQGLELVTGNTAHYQRLSQIGLAVPIRNWRF